MLHSSLALRQRSLPARNGQSAGDMSLPPIDSATPRPPTPPPFALPMLLRHEPIA